MGEFALLMYMSENSLCSCTRASLDEEFHRFDYRQLDVESLRRTGHVEPVTPCAKLTVVFFLLWILRGVSWF